MLEIRRLVLGDFNDSPSQKDHTTRSLLSMGKLIDDYQKLIDELRHDLNDVKASYFLPLSVRSLIEVCSIALLAKIDPYRIIYADLSQKNHKYDKTKPQPSSLNWKSDIFVDGEAPDKLWDPSNSWGKQARGLFSSNYQIAFWDCAIENFESFYEQEQEKLGSSNFVIELIKREKIFLEIKSGIGQSYSHLSKGIHPEFNIGREIEFDKLTLQDLIPKSILSISFLCLLQNFMPGVKSFMDRESAYLEFKKIEDKYNA